MSRTSMNKKVQICLTSHIDLKAWIVRTFDWGCWLNICSY